jgi:hypothetical protein
MRPIRTTNGTLNLESISPVYIEHLQLADMVQELPNCIAYLGNVIIGDTELWFEIIMAGKQLWYTDQSGYVHQVRGVRDVSDAAETMLNAQLT